MSNMKIKQMNNLKSYAINAYNHLMKGGILKSG